MSPDKDQRVQIDDNLLWRNLCDGDVSAFNMLVKRYSGPLFSYGSKFSQDGDIVKDCIQELFIELWNKRAVITEPGSVKWYLFVALRNRVLRSLSRWNKLQTISEDHYDFFLELSIEKKIIKFTEDVELAEKIKKILESLPSRQREIIYLRYYENLDFGEIATIMDINRQSVHNLLQKAYKNIRTEWSLVIAVFIYLSHCR